MRCLLCQLLNLLFGFLQLYLLHQSLLLLQRILYKFVSEWNVPKLFRLLFLRLSLSNMCLGCCLPQLLYELFHELLLRNSLKLPFRHLRERLFFDLRQLLSKLLYLLLSFVQLHILQQPLLLL